MDYLVLDSSGLIINSIEADEGFNPGDGLSKVLVSDFPGAKIGDSIINSVLVPAAAVETNDEKIVRIMTAADALYSAQGVDDQATFAPVYVAAKDFIQRGKFDVARALIVATTVPDGLAAVKSQLADLLA